jgi:hypothetical protein
MLTLRMVGVIVGLLLAGACGSPATSKPAAAPARSPALSTSPTTAPTAPVESRTPVLVGLDQHWDSPSTVILMRPDGSVIAKHTLPGTWVVGQHAVGAYLLVANDGSRRAWTVDPTGNVGDVATAVAALLARPEGRTQGSPLIVDATTAVTVGCATDTCTADRLDLRTGTVRQLLTVARSNVKGSIPLEVLNLSSDGHTVWLRKPDSATGASTADRAEIVGIDLRTGGMSTLGRWTSILDGSLVITPDGTSVAGLEFVSVNQYAAGHLHVGSLDAGTDTDIQGAAELASGSSGSNWILFAPDGASVAWWGPLNFGPSSGTFVLNVTSLHGAGRTLWRSGSASHTEIANVVWVDPRTLLVQTDTTTTPQVFQGSGLQTFAIDPMTGSQRSLSKDLHYLVAVIH